MEANGGGNRYYSAPWELAYSQSHYFPVWSTATENANIGVQPLYNVDSTQSFYPFTLEATPLVGMLSGPGSSSYDYANSTWNNAVAPEPNAEGPPQPVVRTSQPTRDASAQIVPYQAPGYLAPPMCQHQLLARSTPPQNFDLIPGPVSMGFVLRPVYPGYGPNFLPTVGVGSFQHPQSDPATPSYFRHRCSGSLPQGQKAKSGGKLTKGGWTQPKWNVKKEPVAPGGKREEGQSKLKYCKLCMNNGEPLYICYSHTVLDDQGKVSCPELRSQVCRLCGATGDNAHTPKYCPKRGLLGGRPAVMRMTKEVAPQNSAGLVDVPPKDIVTDDVDAVILLPEEMWRVILGKLSDPRDLWNCTNSCSLFEDILHSWKTGWMFKQALPYLYRHLTSHKLLESRQICKSWNAELTNFLEEHPSIRPYEGDSDPRRMDLVNPLKEKELGGRNVISFNAHDDLSYLYSPALQGMAKNGRNPFLGRHLILIIEDYTVVPKDSTSSPEPDCWDKLYKFLTTFGPEIWYLDLQFSLSNWEDVDEIPLLIPPKIIRKLVTFFTTDLPKYAPNLRTLNIDASHAIVNEPVVTINPESVSLYPKLETFKFEGFASQGFNSIFEVLMERHRAQFRKFGFWDGNLGLNAFGFKRNPWPSLVELSTSSDNFWDFVPLQAFCNLVPQLRKLTFFFKYSADVYALMNLINATSLYCRVNTLRLIDFHKFSSGTLLDKDPEIRAAHENLTTLEIVDPWETDYFLDPPGPRKVLSYDFLFRYFPNVKNVHVVWRRTPEWTFGSFNNEIDLMGMEECRGMGEGFQSREEVVEVHKYILEGNMYKSNIWEKLPRLEVFSFQWDVYTRDGYLKYSKRGGGQGGSRDGSGDDSQREG